jgi:hypothetical protein
LPESDPLTFYASPSYDELHCPPGIRIDSRTRLPRCFTLKYSSCQPEFLAGSNTSEGVNRFESVMLIPQSGRTIPVFVENKIFRNTVDESVVIDTREKPMIRSQRSNSAWLYSQEAYCEGIMVNNWPKPRGVYAPTITAFNSDESPSRKASALSCGFCCAPASTG